MTTYYRFSWGAYSNSGEEWFSHERAMTAEEVADLMRSKWPEVRAELAPSVEAYPVILEAWREKRKRDRVDPPFPHEPDVSGTLLRHCGFVALEAVEIDGDPFFDGHDVAGRVAWINKELNKP